MLTIYGNRMSNNCNKVEYTALLLEIPYEYKEMDFQKDLQTTEHLKRHPIGKIPAIDDEGFVLFESGAIVRYLCEKKETDVYPIDLQKRAIINQWSDFALHHIGNPISMIAWNRVFALRIGLQGNESIIQEAEKQLKRFLPVINAQLEKNKCLAFNECTIADIFLLASLQYAEIASIDLSEYPAITNWRKRMQMMDFYKKVHESKKE